MKKKKLKQRRKLLKINIDSDMVEFMDRGGVYYVKPDKFPGIRIRLSLNDPEMGEIGKIQ